MAGKLHMQIANSSKESGGSSSAANSLGQRKYVELNRYPIECLNCGVLRASPSWDLQPAWKSRVEISLTSQI